MEPTPGAPVPQADGDIIKDSDSRNFEAEIAALRAKGVV